MAASLKALTKSRAAKFGTFVVEFDTPGIGHILKAAGCDFALFDMEHSGFGIETVKRVLPYFDTADLPVIVGLPSKDLHFLHQALDVGAASIMSPMVETVGEVERFLAQMKYAPDGRRGVAARVAHDRYAPGPTAAMMARANAETSYFAKIETPKGIDNAAAIAAIDGVDGLWLGHYDLSVAMGIPEQFEHPDFITAVDRLVDAARTHGRSLGKLVASVREGIARNAQGFDFIGYSGDAWILTDALGAAVDEMRANLRP